MLLGAVYKFAYLLTYLMGEGPRKGEGKGEARGGVTRGEGKGRAIPPNENPGYGLVATNRRYASKSIKV